MRKNVTVIEPNIRVFSKKKSTYGVVVVIGGYRISKSFNNLYDAREYRDIAIATGEKIRRKKERIKLKKEALVVEDIISNNLSLMDAGAKHNISHTYVANILKKYLKPIGGDIITKQSRV